MKCKVLFAAVLFLFFNLSISADKTGCDPTKKGCDTVVNNSTLEATLYFINDPSSNFVIAAGETKSYRPTGSTISLIVKGHQRAYPNNYYYTSQQRFIKGPCIYTIKKDFSITVRPTGTDGCEYH